MASREARLILRLIDGVSGPAKGIVSALGTVKAATTGFAAAAAMPGRALASAGRSFRRTSQDMVGASAPIMLGATAMGKAVYDMEKQLNISMAAGNLNLQQRGMLMEKATLLNKQYAATSAEIVAGANELLKAGLSYDQTMGSMEGILDTAQAMDVEIADASAAVVNAMTSLRMPMKTNEEAFKSSKRLADLYAYSINETTASLEDLTTSGKYFNPVAAAMGMSPEETFAWQIAMAKAGIKGSSAGTGLRSSPVSITAPTKGGREALAGLGIDPAQFVGKRLGDATGESLAGAIEASGGTVTDGVIEALNQMLADPRYKKAPAKLANAFMDQFGDELGIATVEDRAAITDTIQNGMTRGVSEIDMSGFLKKLREKNASIADYTAIFGKQHASKLMAINPDDFATILENIEKDAEGTAKRMRTWMMSGIVGDVNALAAAFEKLAIAIGKAGLLKDASNFIERIGTALNNLGDANPELLRFGAYSALALAAIAPLGFAISGLASALGFALNPLTLVGGALATFAFYNWDEISQEIKDFGNAFKISLDPQAMQVWESMARRFKAAINTMTGGGLDIDGGKWGRAFADGLDAAVRAIDDFGDAMSTAMQSDVGQAAIGSWKRMFNMLSETGGAAVRVLDGLGKGAISFGAAFVENLSPGSTAKISAGLEHAFGSMTLFYDKFANAMSKVNVDLQGFGAKAGAWAAQGVNSIVNAFQSIDLYAIGSKVISDFLAGLQSMWGGLMSWVSNAVAQLKALFSFNISLPSTSGGAPGAPVVGGSRPLVGSGGAVGAGNPVIGGARASGGPVRRGLTYEINERGRETVTMGSNGYVTPANRLRGGGGPLIGNVHITGANADQVMAKLEKSLTRALQRSRQLSLDGRPVLT